MQLTELVGKLNEGKDPIKEFLEYMVEIERLMKVARRDLKKGDVSTDVANLAHTLAGINRESFYKALFK